MTMCQYFTFPRWDTIKPGILEHGATEYITPAEQRNTKDFLTCYSCSYYNSMVKCIKARFKFSLKNSTIFLRFVWFCCSGVFRWCYVVVPLVFLGVLLVFWGLPLFCQCSIFRYSVFQRSWFYSIRP